MAPITLNITKAQRAANAANLRNVRLAGFGAGMIAGNMTMALGVIIGVKVYHSLNIADVEFVDYDEPEEPKKAAE